MAERKRAKTSGTPASIREALKKATTEMLVLFVLRQKKMYTYEMMQEISHMSDGKIAFNTLYQAIYRLQSFQYIKEDGKVVSDDNRIRIYFTITPSGEEYLDKLMEEYHSFTGVPDRRPARQVILSSAPVPPVRPIKKWLLQPRIATAFFCLQTPSAASLTSPFFMI